MQLADLQEMQNHMRETIDQGLAVLQARQGMGGLPAAPASARSQPVAAPYGAVAPPPDANAGEEIQRANQLADQVEKEAAAEFSLDGGKAANAPATAGPIKLGQTIEQVEKAFGAPLRIVDLGSTLVYYYSGMKVTFKNGTVSNVE
jgi:hypothetical protein